MTPESCGGETSTSAYGNPTAASAAPRRSVHHDDDLWYRVRRAPHLSRSPGGCQPISRQRSHSFFLAGCFFVLRGTRCFDDVRIEHVGTFLVAQDAFRIDGSIVVKSIGNHGVRKANGQG